MTAVGVPPVVPVAGDQDGWISVGVVRGAFGVQGALKIEPYSDIDSTVLNNISVWRVGRFSKASTAVVRHDRQTPFKTPFTLPAEVAVTSIRSHGGNVIATIEPALSREQAVGLKGAEVQVRRKDFPAPDPDEYYWADLIGCTVMDPAGAVLGTVEAVDDHGAQSVLRLDGGLLIPFVAAVVLEVMPKQKRIVADWSADWL